MPELPDIEAYLHALGRRVLGRAIGAVRVMSPFLVRTFDPPIEACEGRTVAALHRLGKRIVLELGPGDAPGGPRDAPGDVARGGAGGGMEIAGDAGSTMLEPEFVVIHLMIAGRLRWLEPGAKAPGRITQATLAFEHGTLVMTEAGTTRRASVHVVRGRAALAAMDRGGIEPLAPTTTAEALRRALTRENRTLKRALTDPRLVSGIGNAYADEILHAARLSPVTLTSRLGEEEFARLHAAVREVLGAWCARLRARFDERFPGEGDVTAFRPEFAAHGKYGQPCPACGTAIQRIVHAENETNYCPRCQTGGKLLADRSLSRLLKKDWPATIDELEAG